MHVTAGAFTRIYDPSVGEDESWYVNDHSICRAADGTWHLIGITHVEPANPFDEKHLAHASAPSLHGPWTKQPFALSVDASAGETVLWAPHVFAHDGRMWMFVCGGGEDKTAWRIQLAVSDDDGWTWTRSPSNPMFVDGWEARDPMVCRVGDEWACYYTATSPASGGSHVVLARTSRDLVTWGPSMVVYTSAVSGTGGGDTESPFVVARDGRWYLFCGPARYGELVGQPREWVRANWRSVYSNTLVLESDDPFSFNRDREVGMIDAHAAEVVVDPADGSWWITHCGWGEGGVYLAPLHWDG